MLQININPGELAAPSALQPLLSIANLSTLNVRAELDERDIAEIKVGQAASVRAAAFPGKEFAGTVTSIAPLVEPSRLERARPEQPGGCRCGGGRGEARAARPAHGRDEGRCVFRPGEGGGDKESGKKLAPLAALARFGFTAGALRPAIAPPHFALDLAGFVGGQRRGRRDTCPSSRTAAPPR